MDYLNIHSTLKMFQVTRWCLSPTLVEVGDICIVFAWNKFVCTVWLLKAAMSQKIFFLSMKWFTFRWCKLQKNTKRLLNRFSYLIHRGDLLNKIQPCVLARQQRSPSLLNLRVVLAPHKLSVTSALFLKVCSQGLSVLIYAQNDKT